MARPPDLERRQALLDAVVEEFAERGIGDRSLRDLAAAVGTSHRMLLHHFGSRDELLLAALERSVLDLAARFGADPEPLRATVTATRAAGSERRYTIARMSKLSRSRKLKLNVIRHIFHGGESWAVEVADRKGRLLTTRWIAKRTDYGRAAYDFKRSELRGEDFVVRDWLGKDERMSFQELMDEAVADLLKKHHRPVGLKDALRQSLRRQPANANDRRGR